MNIIETVKFKIIGKKEHKQLQHECNCKYHNHTNNENKCKKYNSINNKCGCEKKDHEHCGCNHEEHKHEHCECDHEKYKHEHCECDHEEYKHEYYECDHEEHKHEYCKCGNEEHNHDHCGCGSVHDDSSIKDKVKKFIIGFLVTVVGVIIKYSLKNDISSTILFLVALVILGGNVYKMAFKNIISKSFMDENFLMSIATIGAFLIGEYIEALGVMTLYNIGAIIEELSVGKSEKNINNLMDINPDKGNLIINNEIKEIDAREIKVDDILLVKAGEKIPADALVISGEGILDMKALSGESKPKNIKEGENVLSGSILKNGNIKIKALKECKDSTAAKILDLIKNGRDNKGTMETEIRKFAKIYTPIVVFISLIIAIFPPIILGESFRVWIYRALVCLCVSCPCAIVISVPLSLFSGIGLLSKKGVLVKGSRFLEGLYKVKNVCFDKTGTLTKGDFSVTNIIPEENVEKSDVLYYGALGELLSTHPIGKSIVDYYNKSRVAPIKDIEKNCSAIEELNEKDIIKYVNIEGKGIRVESRKGEILVGSNKLMEKFNISINNVENAVYVAKDKKLIGKIIIDDVEKEESEETIKELKKLHINTFMLTGDSKEVGERVGKKLGIDQIYSELLPVDKVKKVEEIIGDNNLYTAFVGDGINDTPVLQKAHIGISMGSLGSESAVSESDIIIMDDNPRKLLEGIRVSKKVNRIVKENIVFAISVKVIITILGIGGISNMWMGIMGDTGVTILTIINSLRILKSKLIY